MNAVKRIVLSAQIAFSINQIYLYTTKNQILKISIKIS